MLLLEKIIFILFLFLYFSFSSFLYTRPPITHRGTVAACLFTRMEVRHFPHGTSKYMDERPYPCFVNTSQKKNVQRFAIIKIRCSTILLSERKFFPRFRQEFASTFASVTVRWCTHHNINNHSTVHRTSSFVTKVAHQSQPQKSKYNEPTGRRT